MKLFGTSGIRGPAEELFTNSFCTKIGYVFGLWLKTQQLDGPISVANDPRESSPRIKENLIKGLSSSGFSVLDQGVIPTPALTYFVKSTPGSAGGIMVTGSHIQANLNGVKLFVYGEEVTKVHEHELEELFAKTTISPPPPANLSLTYSDSGQELYYDMLLSLAAGPYPKWKVILDTSNGAQTNIMRRLLPQLGLDMLCLGECDIQSPHFSGKDTEKPSDYSELARQVLLNHADLGIGFDVDGDRVIFIDDQGNFIPGDYTCSLLAKHSNSAVIVTPISTSSVVDHIGKQIFRTPVGSTQVAAKMKDTGATFGFEANGGAISSQIHFGRDGGTTMIKLLNLLKKVNLPLSSALKELPDLHILRDKVDCPFKLYDRIYAAVREKYSGFRIDVTDGVKVWLDNDQWLLFRGSGNAPEFRVFAESPDAHTTKSLFTSGMNLVRSVIHPSLSENASHSSNPTADSLGIYKSILAFPDQCDQVLREMSQQSIPTSCFLASNVVVSGMGGSALGGRIIASLERQILKVPVIVSTEYHLPNFVSEKSLVIVSSYSGNTEETLHSLSEAQARGAQVFILTSGGKLAQIAQDQGLPSYIFSPVHNPSNQPRMGLGYNIMALVSLLARCQLIHPIKDLSGLVSHLKKGQSLFPSLDQLAKQLQEKIVVLISSEHLKGAAHAVRNEFNENSKSFAVNLDLPEADHHLLEGLTFPKTNPDNLAFLFLTSNRYHPEVTKRYPLTAQVVKKQHIPAHFLDFSAISPLWEALSVVQAGAYLAYSLSQINGVDPGPIPWVDWMKDQLS